MSEILEHVESQISNWPRYMALPAEKELEYRAKLASKISRVYRLFEGVEKAEKNEHFKYKFASAEKVFAGAREAMAEAGLALLPLMGEGIEVPVMEGNKRKGAYLQLSFEMLLIDNETGYGLPMPWRGEVNETGDKAIAKAAVSALKYFLRTFFLLPLEGPEDDADSGTGGERPAAGRVRQSAAQVNQADRERENELNKETLRWFKALGAEAQDLEHIKGLGAGLNPPRLPYQLIADAREKGCGTVPEILAFVKDGVLPAVSPEPTPADPAILAQAPLDPAVTGADVLYHHGVNAQDCEGLAGEIGITLFQLQGAAEAVSKLFPAEWQDMDAASFEKHLRTQAEAIKAGVKGGGR